LSDKNLGATHEQAPLLVNPEAQVIQEAKLVQFKHPA
jgi:hypothetical protein